MTKQKLKENFYKIATMNAQELEEFASKVSLSNMNKTAQTYLFRAIEIRQGEVLDKLMIENSMAVSPEIREVS